MKKKHIKIFIFCKKTPIFVKVYDQIGSLIIQKFVTASSAVLNFCSYSKTIFVVAKYNFSTQKKILCLSNCCYINCYVSFDFWQQVIIPNPALQKFLLFDANYNLPITATLRFGE